MATQINDNLQLIINGYIRVPRLYFSDLLKNHIQRMEVDGSNLETVVNTGIETATGVEVDVAGNKLYSADNWNKRIRRTTLVGGSAVNIVTGMTHVQHIALDLPDGKIYYSENWDIKRCNIDDGSNIEILVDAFGTGGFCRGITLDRKNRKMYWTNSNTNKIQKSDMDGGLNSNIEDIITTTLSTPIGIDFDPSGEKIYWTDFGLSRIESADTDGSNRNLVRSASAFDLVVDPENQHIYYADWFANKIYRMGLTGTGHTAIKTFTPSDILSITLNREQEYYGPVPIFPVSSGTRSNAIYMSIVGMLHPPTGQLGEISVQITGVAPPLNINSNISLMTMGSDVIPPPTPGGSDPTDGALIREYEYFPAKAPSMIAEFETGKTVTITLYTMEGHLVSITSSNCDEVGNTGWFSWSTSNIAVLPRSWMQYHWVMDDGEGVQRDGNFALISREDTTGKMPRPGEEDDFLLRI